MHYFILFFENQGDNASNGNLDFESQLRELLICVLWHILGMST
jgi:hypothetical protein